MKSLPEKLADLKFIDHVNYFNKGQYYLVTIYQNIEAKQEEKMETIFRGEGYIKSEIWAIEGAIIFKFVSIRKKKATTYSMAYVVQ